MCRWAEQVAGVAAAAVTHQVGLQCHERGRLLTSVWNLLLGLIEFEGDQLRQRNDKLMMENMKQKVRSAPGAPDHVERVGSLRTPMPSRSPEGWFGGTVFTLGPDVAR